MAKPGQHQQDPSAPGPPTAPNKCSGGRQAVVELCAISPCGLVFWSRTRFEIGAEVQVRIKKSALPEAWQEAVGCGCWVMLKGLVVACPPRRREDGSSGFEVSILVEKDAPDAIQVLKVHSKMNWTTPPMPWLRKFGLN